jgi:hypothetical protein
LRENDGIYVQLWEKKEKEKEMRYFVEDQK